VGRKNSKEPCNENDGAQIEEQQKADPRGERPGGGGGGMGGHLLAEKRVKTG